MTEEDNKGGKESWPLSADDGAGRKEESLPGPSRKVLHLAHFMWAQHGDTFINGIINLPHVTNVPT